MGTILNTDPILGFEHQVTQQGGSVITYDLSVSGISPKKKGFVLAYLLAGINTVTLSQLATCILVNK